MFVAWWLGALDRICGTDLQYLLFSFHDSSLQQRVVMISIFFSTTNGEIMTVLLVAKFLFSLSLFGKIFQDRLFSKGQSSWLQGRSLNPTQSIHVFQIMIPHLVHVFPTCTHPLYICAKFIGNCHILLSF